MYYLTRLQKPTIAWIGTMSSAGTARLPKFAIATAYVLAHKLSLPMQAVEDIQDYYKLQHEKYVLDCLDSINSLLPFDHKLCRQVLLSFYKYRYQQVFMKPIPLAFRPEFGVEDFFGLTTAFSDEVLTLIKQSPADIVQLVSQVSRLLEELKIGCEEAPSAFHQPDEMHFPEEV